MALNRRRFGSYLLVFSTFTIFGQGGKKSYGAAQKEIGTITDCEGHCTAQSINESSPRILSVGAPLYQNDLLKTGSDGKLSFLLADDSYFDLSAHGEMTIDRFIFDPEGAHNSFLGTVSTGGFRLVSGLIAKAGEHAMVIDTPTATLGIRGTHVAGKVLPKHASVTLLESEDGSPAQIDVFNEHGTSLLSEIGHSTEIPHQKEPTATRKLGHDEIHRFLKQHRIHRMQGLRPNIHAHRQRFSKLPPERKRLIHQKFRDLRNQKALRDGGWDKTRMERLQRLRQNRQDRLRKRKDAGRLNQRHPRAETLREKWETLTPEQRQRLKDRFRRNPD